MTTPIVHDDGRTDAERAYDALKDGSAYIKAAAGVCPARAERTAPGAANCDVCGAPVAPAQPSNLLTSLVDSADDEMAIADWIDGPIGLQIERHMHHINGSPAGDLWTTYTFGEASISIQDAGGGNVCIGREMLEFDDPAPLIDLGLLLSNKTVLEALDRDEDDYSPCSPAWGAVLDIITGPRTDRQPFGALADGTPIMGTFDTSKASAGVRSGCVTVNTPALRLTADCDGFVSGENRRGGEWTINFDRASLDEIRALRAFLNSDAVERMLVAAAAWENGAAEPPAFVEPQSDYRRGWDDGLTAVFELTKRGIEKRAAK